MAENLTQVNSYQDKLLEAMSIVSSQLISSIPYDKTVTCTIVSDKFKAEGKYKVTNGDATFDAYSSDTKLKVDDVIYIRKNYVPYSKEFNSTKLSEKFNVSPSLILAIAKGERWKYDEHSLQRLCAYKK